MPTPFIAFKAPDPSAGWEPEPLAVGFGVGAAVGAAFPALSVVSELAAGVSLAALVSAPTASLLVSLLVPVAMAVLGAFGTHLLSAHRTAYDQVAEKAGSLMDESWELQSALESVLDEQPTETVNIQRVPTPAVHAQSSGAQRPSPPRPVVVSVERAPLEAAEDAALIAAQTRLLDRFAEASQDAAQRMQVNVRGLGVTPMTLVQRRLLDSLSTHLHAFGTLSSDVRRYAQDEPAPTPQPDRRSPRARQRAAA